MTTIVLVFIFFLFVVVLVVIIVAFWLPKLVAVILLIVVVIFDSPRLALEHLCSVALYKDLSLLQMKVNFSVTQADSNKTIANLH